MKKAIIFQGGYQGHTPKETSEVFERILKDENFDVTLVDSLDIFDEYENIKDFDLFVPSWTMGQISGRQCGNICRAVEGGAGIAGSHGGMCDSFRENTEWQFMTGAQWVAHPGNDNVTYTVNIVANNELTDGIKDFSVTSEQYYIHVDPAVKVCAATTFPIADGPHASNGEVKMPVVFTKMWGKGRVYYNSLGHTYKTFDIPEIRELMRRGFLWAAR